MGRLFPLVLVLAICVAQPAAQLPQQPQGGLPGLPPAEPRSGPARDGAAAPEPGTGRIQGRVVVAPGNTPLRRAQIQLVASDGQQRHLTTTDGEGRYSFEQLPPGRFSLTASKTGYVTLQYGQRRPYETGTPVTLTDGQKLEKVDFNLPKGSVIAVRVVDQFGEPIRGLFVQAQRYQYGPDGQRRLVTLGGGVSAIYRATDDRGEFRVYGLAPGEYIVQAQRQGVSAAMAGSTSDSSEGYSPTFYPGTPSADQAQAISIGVGEEQTIQLSMTSGRLARVSGVVVDADARPVAGAQISLVTSTGAGSTSSGGGQTANDGRFSLSGIPPGEHTLYASTRTPGAPAQTGSVPISMTREDVDGVRIALGRGATLSGRVIFDGTASRTAGATLARVNLVPVDGPQFLPLLTGGYDPLANGELDQNGRFTIGGASGRVFINPVVPSGWIVRSITVKGGSVLDEPLELTNGAVIADVRIVLTDKAGSVSGQVTDDRGRPLRDYVVVILPAAKKEPAAAARSTRLARPDTSGRYEVRPLQPGSYLAVALDAIEEGRQFSPEFQEKLRTRAREFTAREGRPVSLDLELVSGL